MKLLRAVVPAALALARKLKLGLRGDDLVVSMIGVVTTSGFGRELHQVWLLAV